MHYISDVVRGPLGSKDSLPQGSASLDLPTRTEAPCPVTGLDSRGNAFGHVSALPFHLLLVWSWSRHYHLELPLPGL